MAHKIEPSPTGRAACRGCKASIEKGALRFGEEFKNPYSEEGGLSYRYWHLPCAADKLANELAATLATYEGAVEDRAALDARIQEHWRPEMPFAERATSGRAKCRACDVTIKKGEMRVAFERVFESPMGPQKAAAYAHVQCLPRYVEREMERGRDATPLADCVRQVLGHSRLPPDDRAALEADLAALRATEKEGG
jgi:hypothetical protein